MHVVTVKETRERKLEMKELAMNWYPIDMHVLCSKYITLLLNLTQL